MSDDGDYWQWSKQHNQYFHQEPDENGQWVTTWQSQHGRTDSAVTPTTDNTTYAAESEAHGHAQRPQVAQEAALRTHAADATLEDTTTPPVTDAQSFGTFNQVIERNRGPLIRGTDGQYEELDPSYYVRDSRFFVQGRLFSVLFTEPAGSTTTAWNNENITLVKYNERVHTQIRRFVVVQPRYEFCYGCPIFTYGKRATTKRGVRAYEHAIVYTIGQMPTLHPRETGIDKNPIPVYTPSNVPALDPMSRINFGIHQPIQYNVKVKDLGMVSGNQISRLIGYWQLEQSRGILPSDSAYIAVSAPPIPYTAGYAAHSYHDGSQQRQPGDHQQSFPAYPDQGHTSHNRRESSEHTTGGASFYDAQGNPAYHNAQPFHQQAPTNYTYRIPQNQPQGNNLPLGYPPSGAYQYPPGYYPRQ